MEASKFPHQGMFLTLQEKQGRQENPSRSGLGSEGTGSLAGSTAYCRQQDSAS